MIRTFFFPTQSVSGIWNACPEGVVEAETHTAVKKWRDFYLNHQGIENCRTEVVKKIRIGGREGEGVMMVSMKG